MMRKNLFIIIVLTLHMFSCSDPDDMETGCPHPLLLEVSWAGRAQGITAYCDDLAEIPLPVEFWLHKFDLEYVHDARLTRMRLSMFRNDGGTDVPDSFDQEIDILIREDQPLICRLNFPLEMLTDYCLKVHSTQETEPGSPGSITGWLVMQFWGHYTDSSDPLDGEASTKFHIYL